MINWTNTKLMKDVLIHQQNVKIQDLDESELPTDIHMVEYEKDGKLYSDAVRAYKMSDIFDAYYDKLKESGGRIISISSGYGRIKPKMYNVDKKKDNK